MFETYGGKSGVAIIGCGLIELKSLRKSGQDLDDIERLKGCMDED